VKANVELQEFRMRYSKLLTAISSVYPAVFEVMESLKEFGCAVAVCTNKPRILAEKVLFETGLSPYIDFLNAGGDMPNSKPHPQNLLSCIDNFDLSASSTLMVGDSTIDQDMAQITGVPFVQYAPGYDDGIVLEKHHYKIDNHINLLDLVK
jgi:phosphoglycolate phosphatase